MSLLGPSWGAVGRSWARIGAFLGHSWGPPGQFWSHFDASNDHLGAHQKPSKAHLDFFRFLKGVGLSGASLGGPLAT